MRRSCLIITGGSIEDAFAGAYVKEHAFDMILAVDGGLEAVSRYGLIPDSVVGDFDTADPEVLARFRKLAGIAWEEHRPEKDETDTELAINQAVESGCTDLVLLGATGGRMDHALGNLHLLYACLERGVNASIVDEKNRITMLREGRSFKQDEIWGKYISFLPLTMEVHGITLTGFRYPLTNRDICIGTSLCISNELTGESGQITFTDGVLICVESHD